MSMTDPLADMLTRLRNGQHARLYSIEFPFSKIRAGTLEVLKEEGYIKDYKKEQSADGHFSLRVELKYDINGQAVISEINRLSKPGRRVYSKISDLKKFYNGLGMVILSTSKGVMSDHEARKQNVGGELLCAVF
jgi:small subunit ribosomal protein S8